MIDLIYFIPEIADFLQEILSEFSFCGLVKRIFL